MSDTSSGLAIGLIAGMGAAFILISIAIWVLLIIAHWKMFTKAGVEGWKAIIPFYSDFVLFKIVWNTQNFWIYLALALVTSILNSIYQNNQNNMFLALIVLVAAIGTLVWYVRLQLNTAKAYGKGVGFGVGLVLLPNIFTLILGFGSDRYVGPQE